MGTPLAFEIASTTVEACLWLTTSCARDEGVVAMRPGRNEVGRLLIPPFGYEQAEVVAGEMGAV